MKSIEVYREVWGKLSQVNVSEHAQEKAGLTYLSWAWAWGVLMEHYPEATYEFPDERVYADGTVSVECVVYIHGYERSMWLPVMDYRNNAIENPNARAISDTKMRCLVKCLAMWGLGHYIYAGEDLPADVSDGGPPKPKASSKKNGRAKKKIVEAVAKELGAKEVPGWNGILEAKTYEELASVYKENVDSWKSFGEETYTEIIKECSKRKGQLKKEMENGSA